MMHSRLILYITLFTVSGWSAAPVVSAQTNSSSVVDGGGTISSNGTFRNISAIAQGGPPGFNQSAANLNYSGFLNTFLLARNQDTDIDGVADENDPDDDGDGLNDTEELAGVAFDPTTPTNPLDADSDEDTAPDGEEAVTDR